MPRTIGIDLGTSTSEISYVEENSPVLIPNLEGEIVTPSVVHIGEDGNVIVGEKAEQFLCTRPECTFMEVKRLFGTDKKLIAHGKEYLPEEIQSFIIKHLVKCAEKHLEEEITSVVITVPAYFTDVQRRQTVKAGELVGLKVERVINEPTAAALDYGIKNLDECENILVYDFGGGTLDVTVLELFEGVMDIKSSSGNNHLGGKEFDELLMKLIAGGNYAKIKADPRAEMRLKQAAVECKIALSTDDSYFVELPFLITGVSIKRTITRGEFEERIFDLIKSTETQIERALSDAKLSPADLDKVILVGGTTKIPLVKRVVSEFLNIEPEASDSPELTVARGAAVQAAVIDGILADEQALVLTDVCPFTLGAKVLTADGLVVDPLIERNTTVPYEFSKMYHASHEYQPGADIEIYQGESTNPYENTYLGCVRLSGLPRRSGKLAEIEVAFAYDINGILQVTALATGNNKKSSITIDITSGEFRQPVSLEQWENAPSAKKYRPLIRKVKKITDEYVGTLEFIDSNLYVVLDNMDKLKYNIITENMDEAENIAERLKLFLEDWKNRDEEYEDGLLDDIENSGDIKDMLKTLEKLMKGGMK